MKKLFAIALALSLIACKKENIQHTPETTANTTPSEITGCDVLKECKTPEEKTNLYLSLLAAKNSPFQEISMEDALSIFTEQKDDYLFFGFKTCPWCLDALPALNDVAVELGKKIKYVNVRPDGTKESDLRQESNPTYTALQKYCGDVAKDGSNKIYVPFFAVVKKGELYAYQLELDYDAKKVDITPEQQAEYRDIYTKLLTE